MEGPKLVYKSPWLCYVHGYVGRDEADFLDHLVALPHYRTGGKCRCERCKKKLQSYRVLHEGVDEPVIILCPECQLIPNVKQWVRAKRKAQYPIMSAVDPNNV